MHLTRNDSSLTVFLARPISQVRNKFATAQKIRARFMMTSSISGRMSDTALVLGGGNALGAYLAGAYEELHARDVRPDWIIGASIGAVTGAILAGNAPEHRIEKLTRFWT